MRSTIDTQHLPLNVTGKQSSLSKKDRDLQSLRKSCQEFEAIYTQEMYKAMRKTVPEGGLFEKDMASELYKEMMDMEIAKSSASGKGIGIGEAMYQQMKGKIENKK
jgi:flagellar protein FlgJ